jgi:hypothetical protein
LPGSGLEGQHVGQQAHNVDHRNMQTAVEDLVKFSDSQEKFQVQSMRTWYIQDPGLWFDCCCCRDG